MALVIEQAAVLLTWIICHNSDPWKLFHLRGSWWVRWLHCSDNHMKPRFFKEKKGSDHWNLPHGSKAFSKLLSTHTISRFSASFSLLEIHYAKIYPAKLWAFKVPNKTHLAFFNLFLLLEGVRMKIRWSPSLTAAVWKVAVKPIIFDRIQLKSEKHPAMHCWEKSPDHRNV